MRVHLVDGTFELFRCFHGAPRALSAEGVEVGAVRGLLATLLKLLREPEVTHVGVAVDRATPVRDAPSAGRSDPLAAQHGLAAEAIRALGLPIWPMVRRWQADDALATAAVRFAREPAVEQVVICTADKDLAQVVQGTRVVLRDRIRERLTDEQGVRERFGVAPAAIPDLLALAGDAADGLPGLPGFGPKTAAALLRRFGTLEQIPLDPAAWEGTVRGAERLARVLAERLDEARLGKALATLVTDVPLVEDLDALRWQGPRRGQLEAFCAQVGASELVERVPRWRE